MDTARLDRLTAAMKKDGFDAIFISAPKNVQYISGVKPMMDGNVQPFNDPEGFALVQPGRVDILCDGRYFAENNTKPGIKAKLLNAPVTAKEIADRSRELLGGGKKTIGYEADALMYGDAVNLMNEMKDLTWKPAEALLASLRVCKTPAEIELIRKAQSITGDCLEHIAGWIKIGMSERHVALEIDNYLRTHSEGSSFHPIVAFGETSCHPHYSPSPDRKLQKGQMVLLDFGAIHEGYCGDMTRMLVMGKPDARMREVYDLVLTAQQKCLDGIKAGVTCHSLDALCRDFFKSKGCDAAFCHGTGHGVGLAIHEDPRLKQTFQTIVQPGMVVTVEPGLYYEGWGGIRIEDMVVVTQNGHDNLTKTSKVFREIPV